VLYVSNVDRSVAFYQSALGFRTVTAFPGAAFLQAAGSTNDHDLGLFEIGAGAAPSGAVPSGAGQRTVGLYHLAWEVDTLAELERIAGVLTEAGALVGASDHGTSKSLYAKDPDGLEFEVAWFVPAAFLTAGTRVSGSPLPLDLAKEKARYGEQTRGGGRLRARLILDAWTPGRRVSRTGRRRGPGSGSAGTSPRPAP
jgi:catechol 2,3-dioxygenase-like lactoylglutathione lyase family enzyme